MEGFFYESSEVDNEIIDFALSRYGVSIFGFRHDQGFDIIVNGLKAHQKDRLWESYRMYLPLMTKDTYKSFEEYCNLAIKPEVKTIHTKEEILGNVAHLINDIKWRK